VSIRETKYTWVNNIKLNLGEVGLGGMDWVGLAQDRDKCRAIVKAVIIHSVP
jgi:hypothetical protein